MEKLFLMVETGMHEQPEMFGATFRAVENKTFSLPTGNHVLKMKFELTGGISPGFKTLYLLSSDTRLIGMLVPDTSADFEPFARTVKFDAISEYKNWVISYP